MRNIKISVETILAYNAVTTKIIAKLKKIQNVYHIAKTDLNYKMLLTNIWGKTNKIAKGT